MSPAAARRAVGRAFLALGLVLAAASIPLSSQVLRQPVPSGALETRLAWALAEAGKSSPGKSFWVGYGIRRWMGEHSQTAINVDCGGRGIPTLDETIYGRRTPAEARISSLVKASTRPGEREGRVLKEMAILLRFSGPAARKPDAVAAANLTLPVALGGRPLYWLGPAEDGESVRLLSGYYVPADAEELRSGVLNAVALHRLPDLVVPFLERILQGREPERLRADAAESLGEQGDPRALEILKKIISTEKSLEVRKSAIEGLAEFPDKGGLPIIIQAAKSHPDREVRLAAIEALGEFRDPAATRALVEIVKGKG